jgi:serine phosphatase RsbU (regulator of sigma subunit)
MGRLDKSLAAHCPSNRFITLFVGLIDPSGAKLDYCNAGHNPPLVIRASGKVDRLGAVGTVLGILPELGYEECADRLEVGDLIAIYSDGVTESVDADGEEYGENRLADLLVARKEDSAVSIVDAVLDAVSDWTGGAPAEDDVTLVVVRRTP